MSWNHHTSRNSLIIYNFQISTFLLMLLQLSRLSMIDRDLIINFFWSLFPLSFAISFFFLTMHFFLFIDWQRLTLNDFKTLLVALENLREYLLYCHTTILDMFITVLHHCTQLFSNDRSVFSFCNCWHRFLHLTFKLLPLFYFTYKNHKLQFKCAGKLLFGKFCVFIACIWSYFQSYTYTF